jgi:hypothetical protein
VPFHPPADDDAATPTTAIIHPEEKDAAHTLMRKSRNVLVDLYSGHVNAYCTCCALPL